jgi:hypothetical protein
VTYGSRLIASLGEAVAIEQGKATPAAIRHVQVTVPSSVAASNNSGQAADGANAPTSARPFTSE